MTGYVTFVYGGPLRKCYGIVHARGEIEARLYLKEHFPKDWAFLYSHEEFEGQAEQYDLKHIFTVEL